MHKNIIVTSLALAALVLAGCASNGGSGGGGTVELTASGEVLALGGYDFPSDPEFVDGWEVKFDELLVTVGNVTLSESPDKSPTDQSQTGKAVAQVKGPWAVDLHKGGPLQGKGGSDEQAIKLATLDNQNLNGGAPFDQTVRYAFGFDVVAATDSAKKLNFDDADNQDYADMVQNGWTVLYVGTATFKGSDCTSTDPSYDFSKLPGTVKFRLGFKSPTHYVNCQNPDNQGKALGDEESQRGVQIKANTTTIAQVTIHTDHPFWESVLHDSPAHFDPLAAQAKDVDGVATVTLADVQGVNFTAFTDKDGNSLPWRSCDTANYTPPDSSKAMDFDTQGIPYDPSGDPGEVLRDDLDYMTYNQSTQGHLNSDGLCFVQRKYPSPQ